MKFNSAIKTISVSERTRRAFQMLDEIRPNDISFSSYLGLVVEEYLDSGNHINSTMSLDIDKWADEIVTMTPDNLMMLQKNLKQLSNLVDNKVSKIIC